MKDEEVTMHYKTFDTHKYIKSLQESGFNEKQAEMLVKSLLESRDFDLSILATREQVAQLDGKIDKVESNLNAKIDKVESKIDALSNTISSNKYDIIKWMVTLFITMIIAIYLKR
jgi:predicted PurR-regulated permease PerM